jgi:hypothetical protein
MNDEVWEELEEVVEAYYDVNFSLKKESVKRDSIF